MSDLTEGLATARVIFNDSAPGSGRTEHERLLALTVFRLKVRLDAAEKERDEFRNGQELLHRGYQERVAVLEKERDHYMAVWAKATVARSAAQARVAALEKALTPFLPAGPRYLSIGRMNNVVEVRVSSEKFEAAREALAGSPPPDTLARNGMADVWLPDADEAAMPERQHECQRCGSDEWTDVDYSGCSECREPPDPPEPARPRHQEDDGA